MARAIQAAGALHRAARADVPASAAGKAEPKKAIKTDASDLLGGDDDLMDLFGDADEVNEELAALTAGLDDIAMVDLLAQVRDIRGVLDKR